MKFHELTDTRRVQNAAEKKVNAQFQVGILKEILLFQVKGDRSCIKTKGFR